MRVVVFVLGVFLPLVVGAMPTAADKIKEPRYAAQPGHLPIRGSKDAPIVVVEYSDFYCPHCRRLQRSLVNLARLFPGKIQLHFRHSPLDLVAGTFAAQVAEFAHARGEFWLMHDMLYGAPRNITPMTTAVMAKAMVLDDAALTAELSSKKHKEAIVADAQTAYSLGIRSSPHVFIDGISFRGVAPMWQYFDIAAGAQKRTGGLAAYEARARKWHKRLGPAAKKPRIPLMSTERYDAGASLAGHEPATAALVEIVEFIDHGCGFCGRMRPKVKRVADAHAADVKRVVAHRPLDMHRHATLAAEMVIAAGGADLALPLSDVLLATKPLTPAKIAAAAREVGMDAALVRDVVESRRFKPLARLASARAAALGVEGTPVLLVNGRAVIGEIEESALEAMVQEELSAARRLLSQGIPRQSIVQSRLATSVNRRRALLQPVLSQPAAVCGTPGANACPTNSK